MTFSKPINIVVRFGGGSSSGGGAAIIIDSALSSTSTNPVQNKVITGAVDELKTRVVKQTSSATILPNALNVWEEAITSSVTITKGGSNTDTVNHYMIRYTAGDGGQIIFDTSWGELMWYGGNQPEWVIGYTYEISIVDGIALWAKFEPKQA